MENQTTETTKEVVTATANATKEVAVNAADATKEAVMKAGENLLNTKEAVSDVAATTANVAADKASEAAAKTNDVISSVSSTATETFTGIKSSIQPVIDAFAESAPKILGGILLLIIGLILARILESAARRILKAIKIDETSEKIGLKDTLRKSGINISFTNLIAKFVKYAVIILTLIAASNSVGLDAVSTTFMGLLEFIPKILIALVILAGGLIGGEASKRIAVNATKATELSDKEGFLLGTFLKSAIIAITGFLALAQILGPDSSDILNIVMTGFVAAAALAFGLGSKTAVEKFWDRLSDKSTK